MKKTLLILAAASIFAVSCNQPQQGPDASNRNQPKPDQSVAPAAKPGPVAGEKTAATLPAEKNASTSPSTRTVSKPAVVLPPSRLLATVAGVKITSEKFDQAVARLPRKLTGQELEVETARFVNDQIMRRFPVMLADDAKIECDKAKLGEIHDKIRQDAEKKQMTVDEFMAAGGVTEDVIRDWIRVQQLMEQTRTPEKIDAFIKAHPDYFNGTKIRASHILIMCDPVTDTVKQKAALAKAEKIAADVNGGKMSFEDAARQFSDDYSKERGCELPDFVFSDMVPLFSKTAFATKAGQISPIVRTEFGFHIIKVAAKTEGNETMPLQRQQQIAGDALIADLFGRAMEKTLGDWPITIIEQAPQTQTAPAEK